MIESPTIETKIQPRIALATILSCVAANIVLGTIVRRAGLPIYLDTVGTIAMVVLLGWRWGLIGAALAVTVGTLIIFPFYFYYSLTAVGIVVTVEFCRRRNWFRNPYMTVLSGLVIAVFAAILSAPVTTFLFGGVTATGNDLMTAFFKKMGATLLNAVFLSGFASEPVDKVLTSLVVYWALRRLPLRFTERYGLRRLASQ